MRIVCIATLLFCISGSLFAQSATGTLAGYVSQWASNSFVPDSGARVIIFPETDEDSAANGILHYNLSKYVSYRNDGWAANITIVKPGDKQNENDMTQSEYDEKLKSNTMFMRQVEAEVRSRNNKAIDSTLADAKGFYSIRLPAGRYGLIFLPGSAIHKSGVPYKCSECINAAIEVGSNVRINAGNIEIYRAYFSANQFSE